MTVLGAFSRAQEREKKEVVLPSGRRAVVMETTGREEKIISKVGENVSKMPVILNDYLAGVTESIDGVSGRPVQADFETMLAGDRLAILIHARILSHGDMMDYRLTCGRCGEVSQHTLNLAPIIDGIKPYPHQDKREFSLKVGPGEIFFELPDGRVEEKLLAIKKREVNSKLACMKLWEVTPQGAKLPVLIDELKSKYIVVLRKQVKDLECEIDTVVQMDCPGCGHTHTFDLVGDLNFLFPGLT